MRVVRSVAWCWLLGALGVAAGARSAGAAETPNLFSPSGATGESPWLAQCLRKVSGPGLRRGAALAVDCGGDANAKRTRCAAQCDGRCMYTGDFDGDGRKRDVAIAFAAGKKDASSLWIVRAVGSSKGARFEPTAHFPIQADDVALVSSEGADEALAIGQAVRGARSSFHLMPGERFAFGILTWRRVDGGWDGDLSAVVWSKSTNTYRLVPMLALEAD